VFSRFNGKSESRHQWNIFLIVEVNLTFATIIDKYKIKTRF